METLHIFQSTQVEVGPALVGVMKTGLRNGAPTAQLMVRTDEESQIFVLRQGEQTDVFGLGTLTVTEVDLDRGPNERDLVTLTWLPASADA